MTKIYGDAKGKEKLFDFYHVLIYKKVILFSKSVFGICDHNIRKWNIASFV